MPSIWHIYVICVCLRIVVLKTYCFCFCFVFLVLCAQLLPVSLDRSSLIAPSLFSSVYFILVFINIYLKFSLPDLFGCIFWNYLIDITPKYKYKYIEYLCDMEHKHVLSTTIRKQTQITYICHIDGIRVGLCAERPNV
jgi:hypothetical protein